MSVVSKNVDLRSINANLQVSTHPHYQKRKILQRGHYVKLSPAASSNWRYLELRPVHDHSIIVNQVCSHHPVLTPKFDQIKSIIGIFRTSLL